MDPAILQELHNVNQRMNDLYQSLLAYIDGNNDDAQFEALIQTINEMRIFQESSKIHEFLSLICSVSFFHYRSASFFEKFEKILSHFKNEIQQHFSSNSLFEIFKNNRRILLFLIEINLITINSELARKMVAFDEPSASHPNSTNYVKFFQPELEPFLSADEKAKYLKGSIEDIEAFKQKRRIGENDSQICAVIRNDSLDEFLGLVKKNKYSLNREIDDSIYETNLFFIKWAQYALPSFMQYAAYFGAKKIFSYIIQNEEEISDYIDLFGIHSGNREFVEMLEEEGFICERDYYSCRNESIKTHQNELLEYFGNDRQLLSTAFESFNYYAIKHQCEKFAGAVSGMFPIICANGYYEIVSILLKSPGLDINLVAILLFNLIFMKFFF